MLMEILTVLGGALLIGVAAAIAFAAFIVVFELLGWFFGF